MSHRERPGRRLVFQVEANSAPSLHHRRPILVQYERDDRESIPKLVETPVTSSSSGGGGGNVIGMGDPEFLLNRGTEQREVAVAE